MNPRGFCKSCGFLDGMSWCCVRVHRSSFPIGSARCVEMCALTSANALYQELFCALRKAKAPWRSGGGGGEGDFVVLVVVEKKVAFVEEDF